MKKSGLALITGLIFAIIFVQIAAASCELTGKRVSFPKGQRFAVYSGPGFDYYRGANGKAYVSTNESVEVFGEDNGWTLISYRVDTNEYRIGYIQNKHVPSSVSVPELDFDRIETTLENDVSLTDDPLGKQRTMTNLRAGTSVLELAHLGEWTYLEVRDMRGFVKSSELKSAAAAAAVLETRELPEGIYGSTNRDNVSVHEGPDSSSAERMVIPSAGTRVALIAQAWGLDQYRWYQILTAEGLVGYIREEFLSVLSGNAQADQIQQGGSQAGSNSVQTGGAERQNGMVSGQTAQQTEKLQPVSGIEVDGASWQEAYLNVLQMFRNGIEAYQKFQMQENEGLPDYGVTAPLYTALLDITGDQLPELLFLCANGENFGTEWYGEAADLYVFIWTGSRARCVLFVDGVYSYGGNYPWYELSVVYGTRDFYLNYGNNGPGTTARYNLYEDGYYRLWHMADALYDGTDYIYTVDNRPANKAEYLEMMNVITQSAQQRVIFASDTERTPYEVLTWQEMVEKLNAIIAASVQSTPSSGVPRERTRELRAGNQGASGIAYTITDNVPVQASAGENSARVTILVQTGTAVRLEGSMVGPNGMIWYAVLTSNGERGYIRSDLLRMQEAGDASAQQSRSEEPDAQSKKYLDNYRQFVEEEFVSGRYEKTVDKDLGCVYLNYETLDIDMDGIEELIVHTMDWKGELWLYTYENGSIVPLVFDKQFIPEYVHDIPNCVYGSELYMQNSAEQGVIIGSYLGAGSHEFDRFAKAGRNMYLLDRAEVSYNGADDADFDLNGREVSAEELNAYFSNFQFPKKSGEDYYLIDYFWEYMDRK